MIEKKRSVGTIILGIFLILCVIPAGVLSGLSAVCGPPFETTLDIATSIFFRFSPPILLAAGIGILFLQRWARILALLWSLVFVLVTGFVAIYVFFAVTRSGSSSGWGEIIWLPLQTIPFIGIIYYLTRPKVKEQFK